MGRLSITTIFVCLLSVSLVLAQAACPELVNEALAAVDNNCSELGRNEACYGFDQVEASFLLDVEEHFFSAPSDISAVADLETIRTAPLSLDNGTWGVAVMNLQANMPNTLPGQNVTFLLMGDVEVENAVAPDEAFQPADAIEVQVAVTAGANLRSGPGTNFNALGGAMYQSILEADGRSEDGEWLRVVYRERPAWVSTSVLANNDAINDLPTLTSELKTPMQAFYLRTGIGEADCSEAPDNLLLVQGPDNIEIELTVNGADVRLGSSGAFSTIEDEDGNVFLKLVVFDGTFKVGDVIVRRGQQTLICLGDPSSRGLDGNDNDLVATCDPTPAENVELGDDWCTLEGIPVNVLNYKLDVPCPGETPPPGSGGNTPSGNASQSELAEVNCNSFKIISPLGNIDAGYHVFQWTPAPGADFYILVFFNSDGVEVSQFGTSDTSYGLNVGAEANAGGSYRFQIRAYYRQQYACVTQLSPLIQSLFAGPAPGAGGITVTIVCNSTNVGQGTLYGASVSWSGLPAGESISATLSSTQAIPDSKTSSSESGSFTLTILSSFSTAKVSVTASNGFSTSQGC